MQGSQPLLVSPEGHSRHLYPVVLTSHVLCSWLPGSLPRSRDSSAPPAALSAPRPPQLFISSVGGGFGLAPSPLQSVAEPHSTPGEGAQSPRWGGRFTPNSSPWNRLLAPSRPLAQIFLRVQLRRRQVLSSASVPHVQRRPSSRGLPRHPSFLCVPSPPGHTL